MAIEFEFDLVFALPAKVEEGQLLDALFEAGCDDAVIGLGAPGLVALAFRREGDDAEAVIAAAVGRVTPALGDGSKLREVRPDLVSLADVAARLQVTRQALQKRDMPPPSLGGLYRASEMALHLMAATGKVKSGMVAAEAWFNAAPGAQRVNAKLSLSMHDQAAKRVPRLKSTG